MATPCCLEFQNAQQTGTDNEGYGRLISDYGRNGEYMIGCDLAPMNYCPWCGADISLPTITDATP